MVEATSQTRYDDTNADGVRRDYSLWLSSPMGKIWSRMRDACKNVAKLTAASVGRVARNAPKSEGSSKNPEVEMAPATLDDARRRPVILYAGGICGETCRMS
ncbi:uncharacterized protein LOC105190949 [Harpegnathos saltator]|uniref:uncharacterized protein LOC105190949 n=1 Tax=Harpegnathos saltator TaxID=610380 RepID=UPI000DBEE33A|nr:uncharacterized protein LOC105190949 [Harpegnathos saltator]